MFRYKCFVCNLFSATSSVYFAIICSCTYRLFACLSLKVLERRSASYLTQIERRPSSGTTVSVYGFHEALLNDNWNMSTLCFFIMAIAVTKVKVRFYFLNLRAQTLFTDLKKR